MYRIDLFDRNIWLLSSSMVMARILPTTLDRDAAAVVLNKDGSLQMTFSYRGPDLDSATAEECEIATMRLSELVSSMKTGWVLYFEAQHIPATAYPAGLHFPEILSAAMDAERRRLFSSGIYFESRFYVTLYWLPPQDRTGRLKKMVLDGQERKEITAEDIIADFIAEATKLYMSFSSIGIPVSCLTPDQTLSYLHSCVSGENRELHIPTHPLLLDQYLYDTPYSAGLEPQLGERHQRIVAPLQYPKETTFGMFDLFNRLDFPYRWVTRAYCLSKNDLLDVLDDARRNWKGKLQSLVSTLGDMFIRDGQQNPENISDVAINRLEEIRDAANAVEADQIGYCYFSTAILLADRDRDVVEDRAKNVWQAFVNMGFKAQIEDFNAVDSWFASIPGMVGHNIRRPLVSTANLIHMMPFCSSWMGHERCKQLNGPALLYTQTAGNTPYRLNLHVGSVGHTFVIGPTGSGKSVLLNSIEAAFRKYTDGRVIIFDKGFASRVLTVGMGGTFYDLGKGGQLSFQPLAGIDRENERQWAQEWLVDFLREEGATITPEKRGLIRDSLATLAGMDRRFRTMTMFVSFLQDKDLKDAFYPLCLSDNKGNPGEYGKIFDADEDTLHLSSWISFEMEELMNSRGIVSSTLMYIFHRIEETVKQLEEGKAGSPTLIVLDECWVFFDNPMFADKIREWLKTLRKYNAFVVFATQSMDDIVNSPILDTILSSCLSRILLPDSLALGEDHQKLYKRFMLNNQQIRLIAEAMPQRDYYYDSSEGSRLFSLALEHCPLSLAYVAADNKAVSRCMAILAEYGKDEFNQVWLREHGFKEDALTRLAGEKEEVV